MEDAARYVVKETEHPRVHRVWQLAMAFGQGTGTLLATREALLDAFRPYADAIGDDANWQQQSSRIFAFARALGQISAAHAARAGRCVIDSEDIKFALMAVRKNTIEPLGQCAITGFSPDANPYERPADLKV